MVTLNAAVPTFQKLLTDLKGEMLQSLPNTRKESFSFEKESIDTDSKTNAEEKWYELYLQQTLGRVLPDIIAAVSEAEPQDPIYEIAMALQREAGNQHFYKQQIAYLEDLAKQKQLFDKEEQEKKDHARFLSERPRHLMNEYRRARAWIHQENKRLLQEERDRRLGVIKDSVESVHEDTAVKPAKSRRFTRRISQIEREEKRIKLEVYEERRKESQMAKSLANKNRFLELTQRLNAAHEKSAMSYLKTKLKVIGVLGGLAKAAAKRTSIVASGEQLVVKKSTPKVKMREWSDASDDESISCNVFEKNLDEETDSSNMSSLPSLHGSPPPERFDRLQLKYEKRQAARMIQQALYRGEYVKTESGLKIRHLKNWKSLGLRHPVNTEEGTGCNKHTLLPPVWAEEEFDVNVFYDPEVYTRCRTPSPPLKNKKQRQSKLSRRSDNQIGRKSDFRQQSRTTQSVSLPRRSRKDTDINDPRTLSKRKTTRLQSKLPAIDSNVMVSPKQDIRSSSTYGSSQKQIRKTLIDFDALSKEGGSLFVPKEPYPRQSTYKKHSTFPGQDTSSKHSPRSDSTYRSHDTLKKGSVSPRYDTPRKISARSDSTYHSRDTLKKGSVSPRYDTPRKISARTDSTYHSRDTLKKDSVSPRRDTSVKNSPRSDSTYRSRDTLKKDSLSPRHDTSRKSTLRTSHGAFRKKSLLPNHDTSKKNSLRTGQDAFRKKSLLPSHDTSKKNSLRTGQDAFRKKSLLPSYDTRKKSVNDTRKKSVTSKKTGNKSNNSFVDAYQKEVMFNKDNISDIDDQTQEVVGNIDQQKRKNTFLRPS